MSEKKLAERIARFSDKASGKGANDGEIASAERRLGIHFPASYRFFLRNYGWSRFAHQELYGLGSDVPPYLELVRATESERTEMGPLMPAFLVPVMNDGAGNHYCLDTRKMAGDEYPIVFWDHERGEHQKPEKVADTFDAWLIDLLSALS